ncbi:MULTISPECIES: hypothetical protein [Legionella]|uniref:Uncharacterized protein n=1 Tax=Legionella donaldsonii TaxID=45060 RepID=A0A378IYW6_9GAMM|nr:MULTISPECIES: hypothetical protein [Legionella]MCC5014468.1 hypothetical protein [Legionella sp. 31fI33]STX40298.1 Uncharacterised protein [Legionella donaldsonii]
MSWPQQTGDLIMPQPFGHFATCILWLSLLIVSLTKDVLHLLQVKPFTPIPHLLQVHSITVPPMGLVIGV